VVVVVVGGSVVVVGGGSLTGSVVGAGGTRRSVVVGAGRVSATVVSATVESTAATRLVGIAVCSDALEQADVMASMVSTVTVPIRRMRTVSRR
jgi:hypothetical protein